LHGRVVGNRVERVSSTQEEIIGGGEGTQTVFGRRSFCVLGGDQAILVPPHRQKLTAARSSAEGAGRAAFSRRPNLDSEQRSPVNPIHRQRLPKQFASMGKSVRADYQADLARVMRPRAAFPFDHDCSNSVRKHLPHLQTPDTQSPALFVTETLIPVPLGRTCSPTRERTGARHSLQRIRMIHRFLGGDCVCESIRRASSIDPILADSHEFRYNGRWISHTDVRQQGV
jgi:hypothetical protein